MNRRELTGFLAAAALLASCGGTKQGQSPATATGRYERQPIAEVSEARLAADADLIDAMSLVATGKQGEAATKLAQLAAARPEEGAAWYELGKLMQARGWTDSALRCAQRAVKCDERNLWYLRLWATAASGAGRADEAVTARERIVQVQPEVLEHYYDLSNAQLDAGNVTGAIEALNRVERKIGVTEPISLQKQRLWEAIGKPDKGLAELEALATAMPGQTQYSAAIAQHYMQQKKYAKAKQHYDRILAAAPDDEYIHLQLADYYRQTGHDAEADREMAAGLRHPALDRKSRVQMLAQFYGPKPLGDSTSAAAAMMDEAMEGYEGGELSGLYGEVLLEQGRAAEAAAQFEAALKADSSIFAPWQGVMIALSAQEGHAAELEAYAQRAMTLFPMQPLPRYFVAAGCLAREAYDSVLTVLETPLKWGFSKGYLEVECRALAAEAHYRLGHYAQAWEMFDRCLQLRPDDASLLNNYAYYLGEQGTRLDEALDMSARSLKAEPNNANSLDTYGWLLHLKGRDREALPYLQRATALDPQSETLRHHLDTVKQNLPQ